MDTSSAGADCPNQVSMKTVDRETVTLEPGHREGVPAVNTRLPRRPFRMRRFVRAPPCYCSRTSDECVDYAAEAGREA